MKIAYITRIKHEEKLIFNNLIYYYNIGIRDFYIIHNLSNDETRQEVNRFETLKKDARIVRIEDYNTGYMQAEFFNQASEQAFRDGCNWILPIDADEILKIPNGLTIQECIQPHDRHKYGYIKCKWIDYQPSIKDDDSDTNFFIRWKYREQTPRPQSKVFVKWCDGMKWGDGHHLIISKRNHIADATKLFYAHFPNREFEQMKSKRINIGKTFIEKYGYDSDKPQITDYKRWEKEGDQYFIDAWKELLEKRKNSLDSYIYDPIDPKLFIA